MTLPLLGAVLAQAAKSASTARADAACTAILETVSRTHAGLVRSQLYCLPHRRLRGYIVQSVHLRGDQDVGWVRSDLLGWFAVRRRDGQVLEWNVAEERPGSLLATEPSQVL